MDQITFPLLLLLFSGSVVSNSLRPHGLQHARLPCPSPPPEICTSSCPLHQWCHPAISSSEALFFFCPQPFPVLGTFPMSQLFASDDWNTGVSNSVPVLPTSIQGWFPLRLTGLISLLSKGLSEVFSNTTFWRHQFFNAPPSSRSSSYNPPWPLGKTIASTMQTFVSRVISLLFKTLSRFVIAFLPTNKHLLISCLQSPSAVILEPKRGNLSLLLCFPPLYLPRSNGARCHDLSFFNI